MFGLLHAGERTLGLSVLALEVSSVTLVFFWRDSRIGIDGFSFAFIAFVFISAYLAQFFIKPTNLDKEESVQYPCAEYSTRLQVIVITHV